MSLTRQTFAAVKWTAGAKIAQQALQFVLSAVLMRLLGPSAFGLVGMVLVFSGFAAIFSEMGFGSALVQRQDISEAHRSTVFWLTVGIGLLLGGILFATAPLIAAFYKEPLLKPMSRWIALSFMLTAPGMVSRSLLTKAMRFDVLAKVDVAALAVSGAVAAAMAATGAGVWSLVAQQLVSAGVTSGLLFWFGRWRPHMLWSSRAGRELFGYGAGLTGFNVVNYWARSADKLLIGNLLGSVALGLYSRAYSLMLLPLTQVVSVVTPVMFPAMSSIKDDRERLRRAFLRMLSLLTFITFPMMTGLFVVAQPFVLTLFGSKWAEVVPLIQILCFVGMLQVLANPVGLIYTSQGRTDWMFWWGLGGAGALILSVGIGAFFGSAKSVAIAYLIGNLLLSAPCLAIPGRLIDMTLADVWQAIAGNLMCSIAMAAVVWGLSRVLPGGMSPPVQLLILVPVGAGVYGALAYVSRLSVLSELAAIRMRVAAC
jgi:PST family polysaccharide transporter